MNMIIYNKTRVIVYVTEVPTGKKYRWHNLTIKGTAKKQKLVFKAEPVVFIRY